MPNNLSVGVLNLFDTFIQEFDNETGVMSVIKSFQPDPADMESNSNVLWRQVPPIMRVIDGAPGSDIGAALDLAQLGVPTNLARSRTVKWKMNIKELNRASAKAAFARAAKRAIATDANAYIQDHISRTGTLVVPVVGQINDYEDFARVEALADAIGVPKDRRMMGLSSLDAVGIAKDLSQASRSFGNETSDMAFRKSLLPPIANFEIYRTSNVLTLTGQSATVTIDTRVATGIVKYVPSGKQSTPAGIDVPRDNRFQQVVVSSTTGVKAGDSFTIAGIEAVNISDKRRTGQPKPFRVVSVVDGTNMIISPPIVSAEGTSAEAELQYKNCQLVSQSATAAITWQNNTNGRFNPWWDWDSVELVSGSYQKLDEDKTMAVSSIATETGVEIPVAFSFDRIHRTNEYEMRLDMFYDVVNLQPEMNGALLGGQV